jgi:hypothetical protein
MTNNLCTLPQNRGKGIIAGILGAAFFGFIPAFSIPALHAGISPSCILFYRFGLASVMLAIILSLQGKSLKLSLHYLPVMALLAIFYCFSGGLLVLGYKYMSAGVTGVIHFTYPIFVTIILVSFYREKMKISTLIAIFVAIIGIYFLGVIGGDKSFTPGTNSIAGFFIVLASGIACASYMVGVNKTRARHLSSLTLTFWLLLISTVIFGILSLVSGELVFVTDIGLWANLSSLALIATVLSNFLLVYSIKNIGSTYAAILGAIEPVTAVLIGILLFNEVLNIPILTGIALIFTAVGIVIMRNNK